MKSSSPERKKLDTRPDSSSPTNMVTLPTAPENDSRSPGLVTEGVSPGPGPVDGSWKLTIDREPPPGVDLLLFLPVSPSQTNGLTLPSVISPTMPGPVIQVQPQHLGLNAAHGAQLMTPLDLLTGFKQDPECNEPLDLSKKSKPSKSALSHTPLQPIKSEPEDLEISAESGVTERQEFQYDNSKAIVESNSGQRTHGKEKLSEVGSIDLTPVNVKKTTTELLKDIKNEPQSPSLELPKTNQLTEKENTLEDVISSPASAYLEKKTFP